MWHKNASQEHFILQTVFSDMTRLSVKIKQKMFASVCRAADTTSCGGESWTKSRAFWRNKHPESLWILLWIGAIYRQEESSEIHFWD